MRHPEEEAAMGDDKEKIEALRRDLFNATANRGLVYTAVLRVGAKAMPY